MTRVRIRSIGETLLTGVLYFAAARLGLLLSIEHTNVSPVWPPSGIALAAMLLLGRRVWPGIMVGAFLSNFMVFRQNAPSSAGVLVAVSAAIAIGNTLEALAGQRLFRRLVGGNEELCRLRGVWRFVAVAMGVCMIAASAGTLSLALAGVGRSVPIGDIWLTWWLGDLAGILVLSPAALIWSRGLPDLRNAVRITEAALLMGVVTAASWLAFSSPEPWTFIALPPLIWAALRFGLRGTSVAVMVVSGVALWHTIQALGPFGNEGVNTALLLSQGFVCIIAVTHMSLAAAVAENRAAQAGLKAAGEALEQRVVERTAVADRQAQDLRRLAAELVETEQRERGRLSRVLHDHVQQLLVAAQFRLQRLKASPPAGDHIGEVVDRTSGLIGDAIGSLRDLSVQLSPPILHDRGLPGALEWLARDMRDKQGLEVTVHAVRCGELDEAARLFAFEAVRELLFNAVKHGGTSQASVRARTFGDHRLEVEVEDQGRGFDPSGLETRNEGLGLFSIRERLRALGGRFEADSAPGRGALIRLTIPLNRPAGEAALQSAAPAFLPQAGSGNGREIKVIIADDHPLVREGLITLLHREPGIRVVGEAEDGEEAVRLARSLRPDVAILDVSMPRMTGIEAARLILLELPSVRIIGLSMYQDADMGRAMRAAGATAYVSKDRAAEELAALIRGEPAPQA